MERNALHGEPRRMHGRDAAGPSPFEACPATAPQDAHLQRQRLRRCAGVTVMELRSLSQQADTPSHPLCACSARETAQQHTGDAEHSAFPAQWVDGLCRALPGAEFVLASLASRIDGESPPGWAALHLRESLAVATTARTTRFCRTHGSHVRHRAQRRGAHSCRDIGETNPQRRSSARSLGLTESNPPCP